VAKRTGVVRTWVEGGRKRVCLEFWLEGRRRRIYSDVDRWGRKLELTEETASDLLDDIRAEIRKRRSVEEALAPFLGSSAPENEFGRRWEKYIAQKRLEMEAGKITSGHLRELEGVKRRGYLDFLDHRSALDVDYGMLEDWLAWLKAAKPDLSPKTRKHALTAVMGCLRWLQKRNVIEKVDDPPEIPVDEHAPVLLSAEARAAILGSIPEDARGIFLAMALMGLRIGEARALAASCYQDGFLVVDRAASSNRTGADAKGTKTRKVRRLPVPTELVEWIALHVEPAAQLRGEALFRNPRGKTASKRWSPSALDRTWDRACKKAFGHRVAPLYEGTRHSFATLALNAGAQQYSVQKFLGHTEPKTTERYAKLADGALVDVIRPRPSPKRLRGSNKGENQ
jgi:integrase